MKPKLDISVEGSKMRRHFPGWLTVQDLSSLKNLVSLPSSIGMLKSLVKLNISGCSKFESLSEGIGDLGNLESLDASYTLISQPPSSIIRLNKLKSLSFVKQKTGGGLVDGVFFVFPHVNEGLRSLEELDLRYCNLIDGGLPEDIGCLSSLKELHLNGNNFEHLPRSIAQLGALRSLDLSECRRLKEFLGFKVAEGLTSLQILELSNCNIIDGGLVENIGSLSSLEMLFLNENKFEHLPQSIAQLGALRFLDLSYCKRLAQLPEFPQQLDTVDADWSNDSICNSLFQNISLLQHPDESYIHFLLVPLGGLWDASNANGKTPNDYGIISLGFGERRNLEFVCCIKMKLSFAMG